MTPRMEEASTGAPPSLAMVTGTPFSATALTKVAAGRAWRPTLEAMVAVTWAMELLLTGMEPTAMVRHLRLRADAGDQPAADCAFTLPDFRGPWRLTEEQ